MSFNNANSFSRQSTNQPATSASFSQPQQITNQDARGQNVPTSTIMNQPVVQSQPADQPGLFGRMFGRTPQPTLPPASDSHGPQLTSAANSPTLGQNSGRPLNGGPHVDGPAPLQQQQQQQPPSKPPGFFGRMFGRKEGPAPALASGVTSPPAEVVPQLPLPPLTRLNLYIRMTQAWAIYLTLVPAVVSTILKETSFFPLVLLGCLAWSSCLVVNCLVIYYWPKKRIEPCYILDVALVLFFAGASNGGDSSFQSGVVRYFNISMHGWLGCVMLGSYLCSYPWVLQHAKEASPQYVWTSRSFLEVIGSLTVAWSISQLLTSALCIVPLFVGTGLLMDPVALVFDYVWPILTLIVMLCSTRWFPNFARVRTYLPRLHGSAVKPAVMPDEEMGHQQPIGHIPQQPVAAQQPPPQLGLQPLPQPQLGLQPQYGLNVDVNSQPPIKRSLRPQFGLDSEEPVDSAPPFRGRLAAEASNSSLEAPVRGRDKAPLVAPHVGRHKTDQKTGGFGLVAEKSGTGGFGLMAEKGGEIKALSMKSQGKQGFGLMQETNAAAAGGGLKDLKASGSKQALSRFGINSDLEDGDRDGLIAAPQPRKFGLSAEEESSGHGKDKPMAKGSSTLPSIKPQALPSILPRKPASKASFGLDAE